MQTLENEIRTKFIELYNREPLLIRSPGRINLIGEHTDYNDGFVMPAAIDKQIIFAIAPSSTDSSTVYAARFNQEYTVDIDNPAKVSTPAWANFLLGVIHQLNEAEKKIKPFNCVFGGDVPLGAGLSSSAALECGFAFALNELFKLGIPKLTLVRMAQWSEHHYVGVMCGIMDQFATMMGKAGHVIVLDCRSLSYKYSPIDLKDHIIILCDTKVKHSLVDSEYNTRRSECEQGVAILKKHYPEIESLRDVSADKLTKHRDEFPGKVYNRCAYVVGEIARVQQASRDLESGDLKAFGKKMYETHEGLSKLYEVSCKELDFLVAEAKKFEAVLGSRMMGGGFGGCTISIVKRDHAERFIGHVTKVYRQAFSIDLATYQVNIKEGTSVLSRSELLV
jgi:galactokinase